MSEKNAETPETDKAAYWNSLPKMATSTKIVHADLARKLETERNSALLQVTRLSQMLSDLLSGHGDRVECISYLNRMAANSDKLNQ